MNGLALQHCGHLQHIVQRRIGAGADTDLIHLCTGNGLHAHHIVGAVRAGDHRLQRGQVNLNNAVIRCICIAGKRNIIPFPALSLQKRPGGFIRGEDRGGSAQLRTHIGNGSALGNGQGLNTFAAPLNNCAHTALYGQNTQQLQAYILSGYIRIQSACQLYLKHFGHRNIIRAAAHSDRHVQTACSESQHTDTAAGGGMAVRADEGLAGLAETFQMHLMADTVTGTGEVNAVLGGYGLQIPMVVGIFKAGLQGIMVYIGNAQLRLYPVNAHSFQLQIRHRAGGILGQGLINPQGNLTAGGHISVHQVGGNDFLRNRLSHFYRPSNICFFAFVMC